MLCPIHPFTNRHGRPGEARFKAETRNSDWVTESEARYLGCHLDLGMPPRKAGAWAALLLAMLIATLPAAGADSMPRAPSPHPNEPTLHSHNVHSAASPDGLTWTRDAGVRIASASVPCAINDGDKRVMIYYVQPPSQPGRPETVACAVSTNGLIFKHDPSFHIEGLRTLKAVDPSILKDAAGKFRLYYFASDHRGDPARGMNPHKIHLALSDDGIRFRETGPVFAYKDLVDPDVFRFKNQWFMYVFAGRATLIATSTDGEQFTYARDLSPPNWGTTAPVLLPDGRLRLYAFEQRVPLGNAVRSFLSSDGLSWTVESGERLRAQPDEQITDPFVIPWRGGYKMYFKSSPARRAGFAGPPSTGRSPGDFQRSASPQKPPEGGTPNFRSPRRPDNFNPQPPPQHFDGDGPWNRDVIVYRASVSGAVEKAATFARAGVPTIARLKDGRLIAAHQHFPENDPENFDKVAARFSGDEGRTWTAPQVIQVAGLPDEMRFPFDPTLVPLPDGRVRLYFTGNMGRTFGPSTPAIRSAISTDGVNYTYEPGARFAVEGRAVIDCAVVLHLGVFHLFAPDNGVGPNPGQRRGNEPPADRPRDGVGYHATSTDGLKFTRVGDVQIEGRRRWLGNAQSDGRLITFYGTGEGVNTAGGRPRGNLWMATSVDGQNWQLVNSPVVSGGDPGAVGTREGGLVIVITGEPRPGTPGGGMRRPLLRPDPRGEGRPGPNSRNIRPGPGAAP